MRTWNDDHEDFYAQVRRQHQEMLTLEKRSSRLMRLLLLGLNGGLACLNLAHYWRFRELCYLLGVCVTLGACVWVLWRMWRDRPAAQKS